MVSFYKKPDHKSYTCYRKHYVDGKEHFFDRADIPGTFVRVKCTENKGSGADKKDDSEYDVDGKHKFFFAVHNHLSFRHKIRFFSLRYLLK